MTATCNVSAPHDGLKYRWPQVALEKFTDIILTEIKQALKRGDRGELRGFGMFYTNIQKARISRNPKTSEKVNTPEKTVIHWKMSKEMFKKINNDE